MDCAGVECGRRASAVRRVSGANLEVERFGAKAIVWLDGGRKAAEARAFRLAE